MSLLHDTLTRRELLLRTGMGMASLGLTGLFLGPIVLAVIWELVVAWIRESESA